MNHQSLFTTAQISILSDGTPGSAHAVCPIFCAPQNLIQNAKWEIFNHDITGIESRNLEWCVLTKNMIYPPPSNWPSGLFQWTQIGRSEKELLVKRRQIGPTGGLFVRGPRTRADQIACCLYSRKCWISATMRAWYYWNGKIKTVSFRSRSNNPRDSLRLFSHAIQKKWPLTFIIQTCTTI